jgi:hypothetical protein
MTDGAAPATLVIMTTTSLDMGVIERFAGQVFGYYTGGMIAYMIDIGQGGPELAAFRHQRSARR